MSRQPWETSTFRKAQACLNAENGHQERRWWRQMRKEPLMSKFLKEKAGSANSENGLRRRHLNSSEKKEGR